MDGSWVFLLFAGLPLTIVTMVCLRIVALAWRDRGAAHWPTVEGQVVAADMDAMERYARGVGYYRRYTLRVRYRYTVGGEDYRAWQHWHEDVRAAPFPPVGEIFGGWYRDGEVVTVYHHPAHPEQSLLEPDAASRRDALATAITTLVGLAGACGAIAVILGRR